MITNEKLPQTAISRSTLEINKILFAADRHAMLTAYYSARAFIRALYDEDGLSMEEHADLDLDCALARSEWEELGPQVGSPAQCQATV